MAARMRYPEIAPEGYAALSAFGHYVNTGTALPPVLLGLVYLRASALNGCEFCTELHKAELRKRHEPESRIEAVVSMPFSDAFTPHEQAALRWTDVITDVQNGHASEEEYAAVRKYFDGKDLVDLTFAIANINAWNRMGIAFRPEWRLRGGLQRGDGTPSAAVPLVIAPPSSVGVQTQPATHMGEPTPGGAESMIDDDGGKVASD